MFLEFVLLEIRYYRIRIELVRFVNKSIMTNNPSNRSSRNSEKSTNNPKVIMHSITKLELMVIIPIYRVGYTASAKHIIALMITRSKMSS